MKDNATPYYQTGIMFDSSGVKIADPNGCIPDKFSEFERNLPSVKFEEYFPDVVELVLVGENPNGRLSPHRTYWAIKTALIYMVQAKHIYGIGITDLNPDVYRRLISNLNNGIFDNVFTTEDKEYLKRMTWRTAIEMMANIDTDQRYYFGSKHPIAEFFLGVPPLMQYLLPTLTQRLLGNLTVPNINSLNYERQFLQQMELIKDEDGVRELLVQHKTAYIFTMGLHLYRNNFVDINQVIAWLLVSAQLARQSVAIDGVPIGNSSIAPEIDISALLREHEICSFEAIDGIPQYVSVQNPGIFLYTQQFTEIILPNPNRAHGILKTNGIYKNITLNQLHQMI
ncbi:MAG TPA: hypothetical protein PK957_04035 [Candidatus Dojkabacteria bacterium]|nr:hypothetical protein [Candidatus Dojkabacteria bacterium]HQF36235.1 hypothetical protein [Candidatus Dojkabacteria bacterium]